MVSVDVVVAMAAVSGGSDSQSAANEVAVAERNSVEVNGAKLTFIVMLCVGVSVGCRCVEHQIGGIFSLPYCQ